MTDHEHLIVQIAPGVEVYQIFPGLKYEKMYGNWYVITGPRNVVSASAWVVKVSDAVATPERFIWPKVLKKIEGRSRWSRVDSS